jgi:predicted permease
MSTGVATRRIRRGLVVAEFALAIMLLAGAGLLVRSWAALTSVDPGFAPERLLSMNVSTTAFESDGERVSFYTDVLEQVGSIPGVETAGMIGDLFTDGDVELVVTTDGNAESTRVRLRVDEVSDHLFATLRTPLLQGRFFSVEDGPDSPPVAIINEAMSRRLWSGRDPLGTRFRFGAPTSEAPWITIVGVVGDMRRQGLETDPVPQVFVPLAQRVSGNEILLVRTSTDDPLELVESVQAAVRRVDRQVPLYFVTTVEDQLGADLTQRRFQTSLLIGFSIVALVMAAIGIYGLIHYSVATRTREIGLRIAVGARAGHIFRVTVWEGLRLSVAGLLIGLLGALWVGRAGSSLLFGVTATDPLTLAAVSLLLTAVAGAACYFPARRAMRVDPLTALRHD